jgi:hypothetical protein
MTSATFARLFGLTGVAPPATGSSLAKVVARCPRERLTRVVAWYAWESGRGLPSVSHLTEGVRALVRGWSDFYPTTALRSGAIVVNVEEPGQPGAALVTRRVRIGRGWFKESISTRGEVRPEVDVATRWLRSVAGCIVHDDCAENPELGIACALSGSE